MNSSNHLTRGLVLTCLLGLAGCSKPEPTATAPEPAAAPVPAPTPAAVPASATPAGETKPVLPAQTVAEVKERVASEAAATMAAARESLAQMKLPDFQAATTQQLSTLAAQALTHWAQTLEAPPATVSTEVESVKSALVQERPVAALASLTKLGDYAKQIPGGEALLASSKQLVSAWALKQGFDPAKISGLLGSLQKGDYASLATQAAALFAKGGVSTEQKSVLDGVLGAFGLDANQAAGALNAVKGLLGK